MVQGVQGVLVVYYRDISYHVGPPCSGVHEGQYYVIRWGMCQSVSQSVTSSGLLEEEGRGKLPRGQGI